MQNDLWSDLIERAVGRARCLSGECRSNFTVHRGGWVVVGHLSPEPHDCGYCVLNGVPRYVISSHSAQTIERGVLVARLAAWLSHFHPVPDPAPLLDGAPAGDAATDGAVAAAADGVLGAASCIAAHVVAD